MQLQIHPAPTLTGHLAIGLRSWPPAQLYGLNFATATTAQCEMRNVKCEKSPTNDTSALETDRQGVRRSLFVGGGHVQKQKSAYNEIKT